MWALMLLCCANATRGTLSTPLVAGLTYCVVMSTGLAVATWSARSSRSHSRYFLGQCACIFAGSLLTLAGSG